MLEPFQEYDLYVNQQAEMTIGVQKSTLCMNCPFCATTEMKFGLIGFCMRNEEFLDEDELTENTMFDCFEGEEIYG